MKTFSKIILIIAILTTNISLVISQNNTTIEENNNLKNDIVTDTWFRVDGDASGMYFWLGGTSEIGKLSFIHELIYFPNSNMLETEIGPYFSFCDGILDILPMIGIMMDFSSGETDYVIPQLYFYSKLNNVYFEIWNMYNIGSGSTTIGEKTYYGRYISKISLTKDFSMGPYTELLYNFNTNKIESLPIGLVFSVPYGGKNKLDIALCADYKFNYKFSPRVTYLIEF